jgi:solute:Na+ symporter, SSS family
MRTADWIVLTGFLLFIVLYGTWKGRGSKNIQGYLLADYDMKWYTIALSVMATQASAITFLSTPGQAYVDGMRFIQFYLGLPIAMIIISITAIPLYNKLKVFTAYEFLENKFDFKTRIFAASLFLIQRGLAAGLTIYAPSIILSVLLGWNIYLTNFIIGILVIIYTASGGSRAVSYTQVHQVIIIFIGMAAAFITMVLLLPQDISFFNAIKVAGKLGKLNVIDFSFDPDNRYSFWSGLIGGLFLQLSYFGTDQSQVQRYLSGKSISESRIGLLINGIVKIPMQFVILFTGVVLFVFYMFNSPPLFFNPVEYNAIKKSAYSNEYKGLEKDYYNSINEQKKDIKELSKAIKKGDNDRIVIANNAASDRIETTKKIRVKAAELMQKNNPRANTNDTNYIFLSFVLAFLPAGLVGLVLAAIFSASMSSTSSEINALASTTIIDLYKRIVKKNASEKHYLTASKIFTIMWGILAILFAQFASKLGSLIEAVNILGSLFYGTILGIFLLAFYFKSIKGTPAFYAAIAGEVCVLYCFIFTGISYLWYNVVGCIAVIIFALFFNMFVNKNKFVLQ